jgi:hypothetical protein
MLLDILPRTPDVPALYTLLSIAPDWQPVDCRYDLARELDILHVSSQRTIMLQCRCLLYDAPPIPWSQVAVL